jgi:oxygen-independent coproporphyrinogen-3 oxidase
MILQLKRGYLDLSYFRTKFGVNILERWPREWAEFAEADLLSVDRDRGRIELTRAGLLQVDSLLPAFFESQFEGVRYT